MPEEVTFNERDGIYEVRSYGHVTYQDLCYSLDQILSHRPESGHKIVLVDTREQETIDSFAKYHQFISDLPSTLIVAVLVNDSSISWKNQQFGENTAINRGKLFRMFSHKSDALAWLARFSDKVTKTDFSAASSSR